MTRTRTTRRWSPLAPVLVLATLGAACADEADDAGGDVVTGEVDFEPTGRYLAAASERSTSVPFQFEMSMAMHAGGRGDEIDVDAPVMTGAQDGERYDFHMDMGPWIEQTMTETGQSPDLPADELTMDVVGDRETLYVHAPMYAALAESGVPSMGPVAQLAELGDGWGRVDLTALRDLSVANVQSTAGAPNGSDPRALLQVVAGADDVEELGEDAIDGTQVHGLSADVSLGEMLEAQGVSADRFVDQMSANLGPNLGSAPDGFVEGVMSTIVETDVPLEVWTDGSGYVRRIGYTFDLADMFSGMREFPRQIESFEMGTTMDFSGYGDSVEIDDPPADAVDVTDTYRQILEAGQAGG
jgi:hypothetical protein